MINRKDLQLKWQQNRNGDLVFPGAVSSYICQDRLSKHDGTYQGVSIRSFQGATTIMVGRFAGRKPKYQNKWHTKLPKMLCSFYTTYKRVHTYKRVRTYIRVHTHIYIHTYEYIHTHIHTRTHTHTSTYTHIHTYIRVHTYTHTYTHTHIRVHTHIYIHTYEYIHTYTYIHTYIHARTHARTRNLRKPGVQWIRRP